MPHVATSLSSLPNPREAALAAAAEIRSQLGDAHPRAVFVFSTENQDAGVVLAAVREALGTSALTGCRAPAVFGRGRVTRTGVALLALAGDDVAVSPAAVDGIAEGRLAGAQAAEQALAGLSTAGFPTTGPGVALLLLPDGIRGNSVDVVRGAADTAGRDTRVVGGGSGDDFRFAQAQQFHQGEVLEGRALAIGLASRAPLGVALRHGCEPWGPAMLVTDVSGQRLRGLDFMPAFERYRAVAAAGGGTSPSAEDFVGFAMLHPLGLVQAQDEHVLRSPVGVLEGGGVQCCSDVPPNALVRVMKGTQESLLGAAREAGAAARAQLGEAPCAAALVFACISRDAVLGSDEAGASRELAAVQEGVGPGVPLIGCVTFGGFGALGGGMPQYHSKSVSVCALGGAAGPGPTP